MLQTQTRLMLIGRTIPISVGGMDPLRMQTISPQAQPILGPSLVITPKVTLEEMLGAFVSVQAEYNKTNSLKIDGFMQEELKFNQITTQAINDLKTSMARVESHLSAREKGTLPAQPLPNPRTQFEI